MATQELRRGNLNEALAAAERALLRLGRDSDSDVYWRFALLKSEILLSKNDVDSALQILKSAAAATRTNSGELGARRRMLEGYAASKRGRFDEARAALEQAYEASVAAHAPDVLIATQLLRGQVLSRQNRSDDAIPFWKEALAAAIQQNDPFQQSAALLNLAFVRQKKSRYDEAIPILQEALTVSQRAGAQLIAAAITGNLSLCYDGLGDFEKALDARRQAIDFQRKAGAQLFVAQSLEEMGRIYLHQQKADDAVSWFQQAIDLARRIQAEPEIGRSLTNLASAQIDARKWSDAAKTNAEAAQFAPPGGKVYTRLNAARIAAGNGDRQAAEQAYGEVLATAGNDPALLWDAHAGLGKLYRLAGNGEQSRRHYELALAIIERTRSVLLRPEYKITFLPRLIRFYQDYVQDLIDDGDAIKALQIADRSHARVLASRFGSEPTASPAASPAESGLSEQDLKRLARDSETTVLAYWLAPAASHLWAITGEEIRHIALPPEPAVSGLIASHNNFIERGLRDPLASQYPASSELFRILLGPAQDLLPKGSRVLIIPDGALHALNFETLVFAGEKLATADRPHYWIEDAVVSIVPSLGAMRASSNKTESIRPSVLLVGDPVLTGEYPRLPHAAAEVDNIEKRFSRDRVVVLTGAAATPAAYEKAAPESFSIVHFATHATANRESPLDSAIVLSQAGDRFKLYSRDVMEVPLDADLVTISACRTAGARIYSGEGMVGFTWAFLRAGARRVIAGLWDVNDRSTARLMDQLYLEISRGRSPADALRSAKLNLLHSGDTFQKPYYWAPFQMYTREWATPARKKSPGA